MALFKMQFVLFGGKHSCVVTGRVASAVQLPDSFLRAAGPIRTGFRL